MVKMDNKLFKLYDHIQTPYWQGASVTLMSHFNISKM